MPCCYCFLVCFISSATTFKSVLGSLRVRSVAKSNLWWCYPCLEYFTLNKRVCLCYNNVRTYGWKMDDKVVLCRRFYGLNWGPPNSLGAFIGSSFLQIINVCAKKNRFFSWWLKVVIKVGIGSECTRIIHQWRNLTSLIKGLQTTLISVFIISCFRPKIFYSYCFRFFYNYKIAVFRIILCFIIDKCAQIIVISMKNYTWMVQISEFWTWVRQKRTCNDCEE